MSRLITIILIALTIIGGLVLTFVGNDFWFPERASSVAGQVDFIFHFITWLSIFFFVLIVSLMIWFTYRYRSRQDRTKSTSDVTHNTPLELTWTIIPLILVIAIFYVGMQGYLTLRRPPIGAYEVRAKAARWSWTFEHPNGASESNVLRVPVGRPVKVTMESSDVLHALYIPAFRVKQDVVPGRYTYLWFEATKEGDFDLYCAEYCGKDHSQMAGRVIAMPEEEFQAKLEEIANKADALPDHELPQYAVESLYPRCASCHSLGPKDGTGPSWRTTHELMKSGGQRVFTDGSTAIVDENYIRESIMNPNKHIVANFAGSMPTFQGTLKDRQLLALILLIKNLDHFDENGKLITPIAPETGASDLQEVQP